MHLRFLIAIILVLICFLTPNLLAQCDDVLDNGNCDTIALVLDVDTTQMLVTAELYLYSDYTIVSGTVGFTWIHSTADMLIDSVVYAPLVTDNFDIYFAFEEDDINLTNTNKRFLFGSGIFGDIKTGIPGDPTNRRLWATYYFTLQSWSGMDIDSIQIDTVFYNSATVYLFVEGTIEVPQNHFKNIWDGTYSSATDLDADSIIDYFDNCRFSYNPLQEDTDNDGIGDSCCCIDERGNADGIYNSGIPIDVADLTFLVNFVFKGGPGPGCIEEGNVDGIVMGKDLPITLSDLVYLVNYVFKSGPVPPDCP